MLFKKYVSVPANTPMNTPVWEKFKVMKGTITQWIIFSDPEAADLLHFKVSYQGSQLIPFRGDSWIEGFLKPIIITENIELDKPPYILDIYAYNEDDTFPHEIYIHPNIVTKEPLSPLSSNANAFERFKNMFSGGA